MSGREDVCSAAEENILASGRVSSASASAITGRILVTFQRDLPLEQIAALVAAGILSAEANPVRQSRRISNGTPVTQLLDLVSQHKQQTFVTFAVAFIDRLFEAAPPAMIGATVGIVTRGPSSLLASVGFRTVSSQLFALGGICLAVWTVDAFMGYLRSTTSARLGAVIQEDLRNQLYDHLQRLEIGQIEQRSVSAWMNLLQGDVSRIGTYVESGIDPLVAILTNSIIVTTTFLYQSPALFAVQLAMLPGLYWVSTLLLEPIKKRAALAYHYSEQLSAALHGNVAGMSTIRVFNAQQIEAQRITALGVQAKDASLARAEVSAAYIPAIQMVVGAGFLSTLVWGGILVNKGKLSVASFNVMGFTSLRLLVALGSLGSSLDQYQRVSVSIDRVVKFLENRPSIADGDRDLVPQHQIGFELRDVTFGYEPDKPVLSGLNMRFAAGQTTGIVGSTGAGKTTVLKLLLRFYDPQGGSVAVEGRDIRDYRADSYRRAISLVAQQVFLFQGSIRENIAYGRPEASMEEIRAAAVAAQAHDFIEALPAGYDAMIREGGAPLSGGQQQRIAIARALLADRPVLLFDEATSSLDYETEAAMQSALIDVTAGKTTVIVAHRLSTIRHADHIYVLDQGKVFEEGTHDQLLAQNGIYANFWRLQTGEKPPKQKPVKPVRKTATKKTPRKR